MRRKTSRCLTFDVGSDAEKGGMKLTGTPRLGGSLNGVGGFFFLWANLTAEMDPRETCVHTANLAWWEVSTKFLLQGTVWRGSCKGGRQQALHRILETPWNGGVARARVWLCLCVTRTTSPIPLIRNDFGKLTLDCISRAETHIPQHGLGKCDIGINTCSTAFSLNYCAFIHLSLEAS